MNPLAETKDGRLIAADAKLGFDDNAAFRQKDLFAKRDTSQEDSRCGAAHLDAHLTTAAEEISCMPPGAAVQCCQVVCRTAAVRPASHVGSQLSAT